MWHLFRTAENGHYFRIVIKSTFKKYPTNFSLVSKLIEKDNTDCGTTVWLLIFQFPIQE